MSDTVSIVTGAARGIGLATTKQFLADGHTSSWLIATPRN